MIGDDDLPPPPEMPIEEPPASDRRPVLDKTSASFEEASKRHLKGLIEAIVFASEKPVKAADLARVAETPIRDVKELLVALQAEYRGRGVQLDEIAGGWIFRTAATYAPFVRDVTGKKPVRMTRAQLETLAILAYRQPMTRPEIDEIRGTDSGAVLKMLLERDLVRILGKREEPGRPLIYGTTPKFLAFFGLASLKDLPSLREFTELTDDSRLVVEKELGEGAFADEAEGEPDATPDPPTE